MFADFEFPAPATLDQVDLYCSHDQWKIELQLQNIDARVEKREIPPAEDLRRLATRTIRTRGIDYLVIGDENQTARDIASDPARWGLRQVAMEGGAKLYEIQ